MVSASHSIWRILKEDDAATALADATTLRDPSAALSHLGAIAKMDLDEAILSEVEGMLHSARDPDRVLPPLVRCMEACQREGETIPAGWVEAVSPVLAASPIQARMLSRHPHMGMALLADPHQSRPKGLETLETQWSAMDVSSMDPEDFDRALRLFRSGEMLRIARREVTGEEVRETIAELSALATLCVRAALTYWEARLEAQFGVPEWVDTEGNRHRCRRVVMGMGKLGGRELNYSSDIDLIYFYESDEGETTGAGSEEKALSLHAYFSRLFESVTRSLDEVTPEGFCFRVDLGLRPEGNRGAICNSIPAAESYYESWGHPWERVAWVRARPVAGDLDLGETFLETLGPFVWRRAVDPSFFQEILRMKALIDQASSRPSRLEGERGWDVKSGVGGIREIEFFANALQLVYGGRRPMVRDVSTLSSLEKLFFSGLMTEDEYTGLKDAYLLYRRVEHRIQIMEEQQTHRLPTDAERLDALERGLGITPMEGEPGKALDAALEEHRPHVASTFRNLMSSVEGVVEEVDPMEACASMALHERQSREARLAALENLGFIRPEEALEHIEAMQRRPTTPFHARHIARFGALCRALIRDAGVSPEPSYAVMFLRDFVWPLRVNTSLYRTLEKNAPIRRLLMTLFGSSPFLARALIRRPYLLDSLVFQGQGPQVKEGAKMAGELEAILAEGRDLEDALNLSRRYQTEEIVRVGLLDMAGDLDVDSVGRQLSQLADVLIQAVLKRTRDDLAQQREIPEEEVAVFAIGRLGGQDMGYASDLDLLFIYPDGCGKRQDWSRLVQRFITHMTCILSEGTLYEVDTRLRPDGTKGTLVSSTEAFERYHSERGRVGWWEKQALIKWRHVAGNQAIASRLEDFVRPHIFLEKPPEDLHLEMDRLRTRLENEVAREGGETYNVKLGRGGIVEIEFIAQRLQLLHGHRLPGIVTGHTLDALRVLHAHGLLSDAHAETLIEAYVFYRRLENRIRIVDDRPVAEFEGRSVKTLRLARRMGYGDLPGDPGVKRMLAHYRRHSDEVRALYEMTFRG